MGQVTDTLDDSLTLGPMTKKWSNIWSGAGNPVGSVRLSRIR
uniref:Uncharacterized protein n=1 Tax=Klebsiella pneumoniae TaxID=573 RepID=A0A8B0ST50_KLEPN|nr:hypothetical protein [Klebsiella pneumoniae]